MRFKSKTVDNYCVYAVAGTNCVSFGIDYEKADTKGLLGFSVQRTYPGSGTHYLPGFKRFQIHKKSNSAHKNVSTETDPVQSFVWDDFTLDPDQEYTYTFIPVKGKPQKLIPQTPIIIHVKTEAAFSNLENDIFFNRGIASSQAYADEFNNTSPDKLVGKKQKDAFEWLARDLESALLKFINQAKPGETLLGCFYEFDYPPVLNAFKHAIDRGVHVKLIIDAKNNEHKVKGKLVPSSPRVKNLKALQTAKIPAANIIRREANKDKIEHNKFIVYLEGVHTKPVAVWTGSTNITESGIFGQTNVGHWLRNPELAMLYKSYWDLLSKDPGAKDNDPAAKKKKANADYIQHVIGIQKDITGDIPVGLTPIFSPRPGLTMLEKYFSLIDKAKTSSVITLAFGITADLKKVLGKHTDHSPITFMMLEKQDSPNKKAKAPFVKLNFRNNVYEAFGSYIKDPLYDWVNETNSKIWGITTFVTYIHSKFLIQDPLSGDPVIVAGSANFSPPSTVSSDENMVIIRGDLRVADIYFTEFNRLFNHYYYRSVIAQLKEKKVKDDKKYYFLYDTDVWLDNYKAGSLRNKRVKLFVDMEKAVIL